MIHPIKRFKPDDFERSKASKNFKYDLYSGHMHTESSSLPIQQTSMPNYLAQNIKNELGSLWAKNAEDSKGSASCSRVGSGNMIKEIKSESESEKMTTEHIFPTEEGLQPSYADLNKIFDNSDDNSNDDHVSLILFNN